MSLKILIFNFTVCSMATWPNFFIVGVAKAATTSLHHYLNSIPEIYMSSTKEPNYFNAKTFRKMFPVESSKRTEDWYLNLFQKAKDKKIIGEASPLYLFDLDVPILIKEKSPNAKILISLRDPVERLFSEYLMKKNKEIIQSSFHDELCKQLDQNKITPLGTQEGFYYEAIQRYLSVFGANQVKIIIFEEFKKNVKNTVNEILKFLSLDCTFDHYDGKIYQNYDEKIFGPKPEILPEDRKKLIKFYFEEVEKLQKFFGRKLPWPNFTNI